MFSKTFSSTLLALEGVPVTIEASLQQCLPQIHITGLPGDIIRESKERVRACLNFLGFAIPSSRLVIHLSPATTRKQGSQFDLAIAIAILAAEKMLPAEKIEKMAFLGEISIDGSLHPISHAVSLVECFLKKSEVDCIVIPKGNEMEASLLKSKKIKLASHIGDCLDFLNYGKPLAAANVSQQILTSCEPKFFSEIRGHALAKKALEVAIAGRHHILFVGSPGVGKSLLARASVELLPNPSEQETIEIAKNYGHTRIQTSDVNRRPFRSPHHSISSAAFLGGGTGQVICGEVTFAHRGVLFLDEFPEFRRDAVEGLREPLENGVIHLHRVGSALSLPARFTLVATMNPCPCGYHKNPKKRCYCTRDKILSYQKKISGPILDRIDLGLFLNEPKENNESSFVFSQSRERIEKAIQIQKSRYQKDSETLQNGDLILIPKTPDFEINNEIQTWLNQMKDSYSLNPRSISKIIKISRTLCDLREGKALSLSDFQEAWAFRCPELRSY